ncbi:MAG: CRISPR-associated endonuclease Cas3'', partial [Hydrogenobaculum sp.]
MTTEKQVNTYSNEKCVIFSHPNIYIQDHINRCLDIARAFLKDSKVDNNIKQAIEISIALHDFGKFTTYFQQYIKEEKINFNEELKNHALISALYSYFCMSKTELKDYAIFSYLAVKHHHTDPKDLIDNFKLDKNIIEKQVDAIEPEQFELFLQELNIRQDW